MKTFITLDNVKRRELPENLQSDDNRYSESLVKHVLALYTKPGDIVLDMFVGLGTTLFVAEEMGFQQWKHLIPLNTIHWQANHH